MGEGAKDREGQVEPGGKAYVWSGEFQARDVWEEMADGDCGRMDTGEGGGV